MPRPQKQTVDYFPHDCNHKRTMFILEERYGNDGYAFWFKLLEMLGNSKGHYLDLNDASSMEFLLAKTHVSAVSGMEILDLLAKLDAIDPEAWSHKAVWCQNFINGVASVYQSRRQPVPQKPSFHDTKPSGAVVSTTRNHTRDGVSTVNNRQTIVEETIVEETIGEEDAPDGATAPIEESGEDACLPEMSPLEDELANLQSWGRFTMDDRAWVESVTADYPGTIPRDVRDCATHWMAKAKKHSKNEWKRRFRTWVRRKREFGGGNGNGNHRGIPGNQPGGAFAEFEARFTH
jgi:hypothetical protein